MRFKKLRVKNFLSYGNSFTEFDFDNSKSNILQGANGNGKSTCLEALTFAYTGKSYRGINKPSLVNDVNKKDCLVELEFEFANKTFKIVRGIKPNIFEIYENNSLMNISAHVKDYQQQLEMMTGITGDMFTKAIVMDSRNYVPFLEMSAPEKRKFIEDILGISDFRNYTDLVKSNISEIKLQKNQLNSEISKHKELIQYQQDQLKEMKQDVDVLKDLIAKLNVQIEDEKSNIEEMKPKKKKLQETIEKFEEKNKQMYIWLSKNSHLERDLLQYKKKLENQEYVCDKCGAEISKDKVEQEKLELEETIENLTKKVELYEERKEMWENLKEKIKTASNNMITLNTDINTSTNKIQNYNKMIEEYNKKLDSSKLLTLQEKLLDNQNKIETLEIALIKADDDFEVFDIMKKILADNGIKKFILDRFSPVINERVNNYLDILDAPYRIDFDDQMNETVIGKKFEGRGYQNFSAGEKQRCDLSLLFAFLDIFRLKNKFNCNILFFDEMDASLDTDGIDGLMKIFDELKTKGYTIYFISHKDSIVDRFDVKMKFTKDLFTKVEKIG